MDVTLTSINASLVAQLLIERYPCFHGIPVKNMTDLINHGTRATFDPKEFIVHQDDWVDSVIIILSGRAEVSIKKLSKFRKKIGLFPVAEMHQGDVIGLNETGFYSTSGKRTATVSAITTVDTIKIELKQLQQFFEQFPQHHTLQDTAYQFLKIKLIKEALPFVNVPHERLMELCNKIQTRTAAQDEIVFHEQEIGNECFLIVEGEISIIRQKKEEQVELAVLKAPSVFGEAALITNEPRNAGAKAKTPCTLLEIKKEYLTELLETKENIEETFMSLMINRSRPKKSAFVEEYVQNNTDSSQSTILKQTQNESYLKLSEEGAFIWSHLNGENTLKDITLLHCKTFKLFSPQTITSVISKLSHAGFIENLTFTKSEEKPKNLPQKIIKKTMHYMNYRKSFGDADIWISKKYRQIQFLFNKPVVTALLCFALSGFLVFLMQSDDVISLFQHKEIHIWLLLSLVPLSLFSVIMHELGHAFSVKHFKRDIHYIGIAWNWMMPSAFTDTSDMWLAEKKARIIVNLSGVFNDILLSSIAAWLILLIPVHAVQAILWLFCLYTYMSAFKNLNPMSESDGYYILVDWFDRPNLKESAVLWLGHALRKKKHKFHLKKMSGEFWYWILCGLFLFGVVIITLFVQNFIMRLLNLPESNPYFTLVLPVLTMVMTAVSAFRNQKKLNESLA